MSSHAMRIGRRLSPVVVLMMVLATPLPARAEAEKVVPFRLLVSYDAKAETTILAIPGQSQRQFAVKDISIQEKLASLAPGDRMAIVESGDSDHPVLDSITNIQRPVSAKTRTIAVALAAAIILAFAAAATRFRPLTLLVGVDNRISKSQTQLAIWFGVAMLAYLATIELRVWAFGFDYIGGIGITSNLLALSGLSALSFGGAKAITISKAADPAIPSLAAKTTAAAPKLIDLFSDDSGRPDLGDFQMMFVTVLAAVVYFFKTWQYLAWLAMDQSVDLPDVDTALLSAFGIGQGAYLVKKAASDPGKG